jgi:hypothetical protein
VPLPPLVIVIHVSLLSAIQLHPEPVVSEMVPGPPATPADGATGVMVKLQVPLCVTVTVFPVTTNVPVRGIEPVFGATE